MSDTTTMAALLSIYIKSAINEHLEPYFPVCCLDFCSVELTLSSTMLVNLKKNVK